MCFHHRSQTLTLPREKSPLAKRSFEFSFIRAIDRSIRNTKAIWVK
jgi:hypothetical protein